MGSARYSARAFRHADSANTTPIATTATETWEGKRLQKFVYKGIGTVLAGNQGVLWPKR